MNKLVKRMKLEKITPGKSVSRASINLKMSDCSSGWHGNKRSPTKIGITTAKPGRNITTPKKGHQYGLVEQQGGNSTGAGKTPRNAPKRRERKPAIIRTPARGQSTMLQYVSTSKTVISAVGAAYQDTQTNT